MTSDQMKQYEMLSTLKERAAFLLGIGVTAKPNIVDLDALFILNTFTETRKGGMKK